MHNMLFKITCSFQQESDTCKDREKYDTYTGEKRPLKLPLKTLTTDKADNDFITMLKELKKTVHMELKEGTGIVRPQVENINREIKVF